jgi:pyruvate/2-oxoglutarate/acetoin dehydrogenase E1 component
VSTTFRQAVNRALGDAMEADEDVFLIGEDIAQYGGPFKTSEGLLERFGDRRVLDAPISEQAIVGCGVGAAIQGLRPVVELMFADFAAVCFDQLVNSMAKYGYMSGGQANVPMTVRMANGAGAGFASQHSQSVENWFLNVPGLKIVAPSTPADAYGLLRAAIEDPNPVLVFEHKLLYNNKDEVADTPVPMELGQANTVRAGDDITVVATQQMVHHALEAAEQLEQDGIGVEVVDPRTLVPLDLETIGGSVDRTGHLMIVQESPFGGCWGSTVVAAIVRDRFESLDAAPVIVAADRTPIPFAGPLETAWIPSADRIAEAIRHTLRA